MNKKLLALAVAAALAPVAALADGSSVTLTGVIDGSYENYKRTDANGNSQTQTGIGSNATRWNINGSEDLGDGLKAIFGLAVDQAFSGRNNISVGGTINNGTGIANRNSFVGLAGDSWGSLKLGQNEHEYEIQAIKQDPFPASETNGNALSIATRWGIGASGGYTRRDPQTIWYATPDWSGFQGNIAYITDAQSQTGGANPTKPKGFQLAGQYTVPGIGLTAYAAYADYSDLASTFAGVVSDSGSKDKAWRVGLGYTIADLTLNFGYESLKEDGNPIVAGVTDATRKNWQLGGDYRIGAGAIKLLYEKGQKVGGSVCNVLDCTQTTAKLITVGYWHDLSKRTTLFVDYYKIDNDAQATYVTGAAGVSQKGFSLGMRTTF